MIGRKISHYEVLDRLGAGGMGEVYIALDTRLERKVALKVLPRELIEDREALARFEREAKSVAALSHPNILGIYDFDRAEGLAFAAMELLEGTTLAERLADGPLPLSKVLDYGSQIARGLAAAHDRGVVHRDLKPQNLFVTPTGRVKILDFGLAKLNPLGSSADAATATVAGEGETEPGKVMGTVGYMSPEQVRGDAVDHRSDIFSLGTVLYQMITGRRAFSAGSAVETMSAILKEEPPALAEEGTTSPPALERIVRHCLEKSPGERFQSARDLAFALATVGQETTSQVAAIAEPGAAGPAARRWLAPTVLLVSGLAIGGLLGARFASSPAAPPPAVQIRPLTFSGTDNQPAISPDARTVAFVSSRDGRLRIWLKQLAGGGEAPLTDGPDVTPEFAPDGSGILFVRAAGSASSIYRQPLVGGSARKMVDDAFDGAWSPDGERLAFLRSLEIGRVTALLLAAGDGTGAREIHRVETFNLSRPRWAPDGRRVLVVKFVPNSARGNTLLVVDAGSGEATEIVPRHANYTVASVRWLDDHTLVYGQSARIGFESVPAVVVRHDLRSGASRDLFWAENGGGAANLALLPPDRILFDTLTASQTLSEIELARPAADRSLTRGQTSDRQPVYSPDGRRVLFSSSRSGNLDLWLLDLEDGTLQQLTDDASNDWDPAFTPDGEGILWSSDRGGHLEIWSARLDGSGVRQLSNDGYDAENPTATPDGRWIVYGSGNPRGPGIYRMPAEGGEGTRLAAGTFLLPEISPDGRHAVFIERDTANNRNFIRAVAIETGELADFTVEVPIHETKVWTQNVGRSRWLPGTSAIVWTGQDEAGRAGLYVQEFAPGRDTTATRRKLAGFDPELELESFGISPDGRRVTISRLEEVYSIKVATGVPGLDRP